jgi:hypothetical protein
MFRPSACELVKMPFFGSKSAVHARLCDPHRISECPLRPPKGISTRQSGLYFEHQYCASALSEFYIFPCLLMAPSLPRSG